MQLIYSSTRKTGIVGQKTDSGPSYVVSAFCEKAVEAGTLVVFDGDQKCRAPAAKEDLDLALGIVLSQGFAIKPGSMLSILRSGRVWVDAGGDIAAGSPVFVNFKSGAFVAQESPEAIKLKNACFLSSGKKDDVVELELNFDWGCTVNMINRLDASLDGRQVAFLENQLEYIKSQTYDIQYPALKARLFIPVSNDIPNGAASFTYQSWDESGRAELISSYGDDFKRVGVGVKEFVGSIKSVGASYAYSIEDLRRSAFSGANLDSRLARAARNAIEFELDHLAAFGHKDSQLSGFLNHPNVVSKKTTAWFGQQPKDTRKILDDLAGMVSDIIDRTEEVHAPDTILMPTKHYAYLAQTPVNPNSETTILKSFLANNPYIKGIDSWKKLDDNGRIVAYRRAPEICELQIPQEFEQFPPQARNMEFVINCHAKFAGVSIYYPLAVAYLDTV